MKKLLVVVVVMAGSFALGRYTADYARSVEVVTDTATDTTTREQTTTTTSPSGETKTVKTVDTSTKQTRTQDKKDAVSSGSRSKLNVSALASLDVSQRSQVVYGLIVTREMIGPVTIGVFGLTSGVVGVSLGLNFRR